MTKNEKIQLANKCGYEYTFSGKTGEGFFKERTDTQNIIVSFEDLAKLKDVIAQEK